MKRHIHKQDVGRDIALRCPHPRSSGRNSCAAERGADGAARRPYQDYGPAAQQGIALVITLIMLSVITFMAVTFLAVSRRERGSVTTANDQITARLAADAGLANAESLLVGTMLATTNGQFFDLLVSTNYITAAGFDPSSSDPNPTNVNYDHEVNGAGLSAADFLRNLNNLQYAPRAPVYVSTNISRALPLDFRFYLDLNENHQFDTNGSQPVIGPGNNPETVNGVTLSNNFTGDPEWIGVLANPLAPHSPTNRFVGRFAYAVVPAGKTLDLNYIHNQANDLGSVTLNTTGSDFRRNQGVGTWEINLAAFLCDLNTNQWDPTTANNYQFDPLAAPTPQVSGVAFEDAESIYSYRLNGNYGSLSSAFNVLNGALPLANGYYDAYDIGPLMTAVNYTNYIQPITLTWLGANNPNQFFTPQDLFNRNNFPHAGTPDFVDRLTAAGTASDSYDRYTFYRLLAQMGTDTGPESGKLNVNYMNFTNLGAMYQEIPNSATNMLRWTTNLNLFNDAADMLIRMYTTNWLAEDPNNFVQTFGISNAFSITNIPVWVSNRFVYTPSVHRLLQLAANICEVTGNNEVYPIGFSGMKTNFPNVFRPIFSKYQTGLGATNYAVYISGYTNIEAANTFIEINPLSGAYTYVSAYHDLYNPQDISSIPVPVNTYLNMYTFTNGLLTPDMVDGVPLIIGARKGFPNFNQLSESHGVTAIRKLEFQRADPSTGEPSRGSNPVLYTNQLYTFVITNVAAMEAWNSYSNAYPGRLQLIASNNCLVSLYTNNINTFTGVTNQIIIWTNNASAIYSQNISGWPGFTMYGASAPASLQQPSFIVPFTNYFNFTTNLEFNQSPPTSPQGFGSDVASGQVGVFQVGPGVFPVYRWWVGNANRLRYALVDTDANRIVDYVSLVSQDPPIDIVGDLTSQDPNFLNGNLLGGDTDPTPGGQWVTNIVANTPVPVGVRDQILAGLNTLPGFPSSAWNSANLDPTYGGDKPDAIINFQLNMYSSGGNEGIFNAPYVPVLTIAEQNSYQVNDPFVHYNIGDLGLTNSINLYTPAETISFLSKNLGRRVNDRYQPWGLGPPQAEYAVQYKDPAIAGSDYWNFPTNALPNVGWLGRIHRGSPWQTVYMKSWDVDTNQADNLNNPSWRYWTGNPNVVDALRTRPVEDWKIFDLFTTALNDNSTEGQLSVNQSGLAAWSAILSGVITLTNNVSDANVSGDIAPTSAPWVIEPAGDDGTNSPLGRIVTGINATRAGAAYGFNGSFQHVGDILATPELTIGVETNQAGVPFTVTSPYLNADSAQQVSAINDEMYERIPQQIMSLLRLGETRFVIYSYGQTLRPALNSIVTSSGPMFGLCTNYQITAEVATRAVVRVDGAPQPGNTNSTPHLTVESFNVLPPD